MAQIPESANKGLENIVACTSEVSTIHDTTLLYRGHTIEDLAENTCFEEVAHLLWYGNLPNNAELSKIKSELAKGYVVDTALFPIFEQIAKTQAHPMAKLRTAVSFYALKDPSAEDLSRISVLDKAARLTGALGVIIAALSRAEQGQPLVKPQPDKSIAWNFLNMVRNQPPNEEELKLFDTSLILHADHELNASSFTARVVASSQSDYYSAVVGAIGTLKGPLHGGANEHVMIMLKEIGGFNKIDAFLDDAINAKKKVMGIGHRVYKNGDPRARILKEMSANICKKTGLEEHYRMLTHIEQVMGEKKGLMPNVDFYSGVVYTALKIRPRDFTPIFALSRITGWSAQILEQMANNRIYRPRAFYTGPTDSKVSPISKR